LKKQLEALVGQSEERQELLRNIEILNKDIKDNLGKYKDMMDKLPGLVEQMIITYEECLLDSTPDKKADYFEERDHL
jgi:hypothetical protein